MELNIPLFHPYCRCSTAAHMDREELEKELKEQEEEREFTQKLEKQLENFNPLKNDEVVNTLRKESEKWIKTLTPEQKRSIQKYTYNGKDKDGKRLFEKINLYFLGKIETDEKNQEIILRNAANIEAGILKNELKHDIILYRKDVNPSKLSQNNKKFISTSVTKKGVLGKKPNVIIYAYSGINGAYIEPLAQEQFKKQREFLLNRENKLEYIGENKGIHHYILRGK